MEIRKANKQDIPFIAKLYSSLVGSEGCVWNEFYPTIEDAENDFEHGALYVVRGQDGSVIAAASAGEDEEQEELAFWSNEIKRPCELTRVCVSAEYQKKGIASKLVSYIEKDIVNRGYDGIRLLAYCNNKNAVSLYERLEYKKVGEAEMYGIGLYYGYEKRC